MVFRVKRRGIFLLIVWILMLLAVLSALTLLEATFNSLPGSHTIASVGWAGYIVASSFNRQEDVVSVSGQWTVPHADPTNGDGYSSAWIGIGGQEDKTLIQVGTEHNINNGNVSYGAWYEMLPAFSTRINNLPVSPGDQMSAKISLINGDFNQWNIQISDLTTGESFSQDFQYNSTRSSGEWILERSLVNNQITALADFGSVTFNACNVQVGNQTGNINNFTYSVVQMTNQQYERLATASTLGPDGGTFTVTYDKRT